MSMLLAFIALIILFWPVKPEEKQQVETCDIHQWEYNNGFLTCKKCNKTPFFDN